MNFTSLVFFIYLPAVVLIHWLLPHKFRWIFLLAASYLFYAFYNVWLSLMIFTTTFVAYICGLCTEAATTKKGKKSAVCFAAVVCLGLLFVFKYLDFTIGCILSVASLFGAKTTFSGFNIILPAGISFYTFQTMSYTFDVYSGKIKAEKHFGYFALFVVFFPQLVAGPIERPGDLIPQLREKRTLNAEDFAEGLRFLIIGYAQKVLIADALSPFVDGAYSDVYACGGAALTVSTILFAFQIYCDFSGYSMIAAGCAKFMGIKLCRNFDRPYLATSFRDFWHRWHITLSRWFTDYLYIPLGGNRKGKVRKFFNVLIVFLVSGLWHGANLTFVVWGLLHGFFVALEGLFPKREKESPAHIVALKRIATFFAVCFCWIFFRASTLAEAGEVIRLIFTDWRIQNVFADMGMTNKTAIVTMLLVALIPLLERLPHYPVAENTLPLARTKEKQSSCAAIYAILIIAIVVCRCICVAENGASGFIYFSF